MAGPCTTHNVGEIYTKMRYGVRSRERKFAFKKPETSGESGLYAAGYTNVPNEVTIPYQVLKAQARDGKLDPEMEIEGADFREKIRLGEILPLGPVIG